MRILFTHYYGLLARNMTFSITAPQHHHHHLPKTTNTHIFPFVPSNNSHLSFLYFSHFKNCNDDHDCQKTYKTFF